MEDYGMKILCRIRAGSRVFYEESIVRVKAESFDEAYERAEAYALSLGADEYVNVYGEAVKTELVDIVGVFRSFDEEDGVQEVYSRTMINRTDMDEEKWLDILSDGCTAEEKLPLRERALNEGLVQELK